MAATLKIEFPRATDTVARYGGEEFVVLLPDTNLDDLKIMADRLVKVIADIELFFDGQTVSINCSIGLSCAIPDYAVDSQTLLIAADKALYQAKENGRNQWVAVDEMLKPTDTILSSS